jgi:hypothetical protein
MLNAENKIFTRNSGGMDKMKLVFFVSVVTCGSKPQNKINELHLLFTNCIDFTIKIERWYSTLNFE